MTKGIGIVSTRLCTTVMHDVCAYYTRLLNVYKYKNTCKTHDRQCKTTLYIKVACSLTGLYVTAKQQPNHNVEISN